MIYGSPIWRVGNFEVSFIGEVDKWCPVSPQRFYNVEISSHHLTIYLKGTPGEIVNLQFTTQQMSSTLILTEFACKVPSSGRAMFIFKPIVSEAFCL